MRFFQKRIYYEKGRKKRQLEELKALQRLREGKLLKFTQAADYLGVSFNQLYKLTKRKVIPFYKATRRIMMFSKDELDEWVVQDQKSKVKSQKAEKITEDEDEEEEDEDTSSRASASTSKSTITSTRKKAK